MGLGSFVKRTLNSITPPLTRAQGGAYVTTLPTGAGTLQAAPLALTANAVINIYGAIAAAIAATANVTDSWVEGVILGNPSVAAKEMHVLVTTAAAIATGVASLPDISGEVGVVFPAVTDSIYLPFGQPIFIPAGVAINACLACANTGGKTAEAFIVVSRNK